MRKAGGFIFLVLSSLICCGMLAETLRKCVEDVGVERNVRVRLSKFIPLSPNQNEALTHDPTSASARRLSFNAHGCAGAISRREEEKERKIRDLRQAQGVTGTRDCTRR